MQHSSTLNHATLTGVRHTKRGIAGSRSLSSMLPSMITTGVITLVITAVMRSMWMGIDEDFFGAWIEAWLTTWPIAFPLFYLSRILLRKISKNAAIQAKKNDSGNINLSLRQIKRVSDLASNKNNLKRRNIRVTDIYS